MTPEEVMAAIRKLTDEEYEKFLSLFKCDEDVCSYCFRRGCLPHAHNDE
jgi:succinate dehydrogenase flavin-adding protein (antitoxin of CptAB toxin-antitoxin module)